MVEAAKGFCRLKAYRQLPILRAALVAHAAKRRAIKNIEPQAHAAWNDQRQCLLHLPRQKSGHSRSCTCLGLSAGDFRWRPIWLLTINSGGIGCKGQPRNIHSLGDDASLAMAHGHVAQCAIEMLAPHLLIHQEWRHRHDFSVYAQLNKDASGHSKTQHDDDIAFVIALPVRHPPVLRDRSAVRSVTQRAQEILPDRLTLSGL
jgi:hypothetical protein